jgi:hypothetical protein
MKSKQWDNTYRDVTIKDIIDDAIYPSGSPGAWEDVVYKLDQLAKVVIALSEQLTEKQQLDLANRITYNGKYSE